MLIELLAIEAPEPAAVVVDPPVVVGPVVVGPPVVVDPPAVVDMVVGGTVTSLLPHSPMIYPPPPGHWP